MRKQILQSWTSRALARVVVAAQVLSAIPVMAAEPAPVVAPAPLPATDPDTPPASTAPPPPPQVTVNRTLPHVEPVPLYAVFSEAPTAEEITKARVFGEPIFPIGGTPTPKENRGPGPGDPGFPARRRRRGRDALRDVPGGVSRHAVAGVDPGGPGRALQPDGVLHPGAGRAGGSLGHCEAGAGPGGGGDGLFGASGAARVSGCSSGRWNQSNGCWPTSESGPSSGSVAESVRGANATVWGLRNKHEDAIPSGPVSLDRIRVFQKIGGPERHSESLKFPATHDGAGLDQMADLAGKMGLKMRIARRQPGAKLVLPALMHLKAGHFTAVVREEKGRYLLDDPLLGGEFWMSRAALEEESSGYFLVPDRALAAGWSGGRAG